MQMQDVVEYEYRSRFDMEWNHLAVVNFSIELMECSDANAKCSCKIHECRTMYLTMEISMKGNNRRHIQNLNIHNANRIVRT